MPIAGGGEVGWDTLPLLRRIVMCDVYQIVILLCAIMCVVRPWAWVFGNIDTVRKLALCTVYTEM